jgi:hypothetical protein
MPISPQAWVFDPFARKGVFPNSTDLDLTEDVYAHARASGRGLASLLFGALLGCIGGKYRKIKKVCQGVSLKPNDFCGKCSVAEFKKLSS